MTDANQRDDRTDRSLLHAIEKGRESAANTVFDRYAPRLLAVANKRLSAVLKARVDPEDIVQSTFKSFFKKARDGAYHVPESGDLLNLLIVITMRKVNSKADYHQAGKRDVRRSKNYETMDEQVGQHRTSLAELCMTIDEISEGLAEGQKQIITLRLQGYSLAEIAEISTRSKRTVERELQNFRKKLTSYFE